MSRKLFGHYGTGIFPRPNDDIDPKNKDEKWHLEWCRYIFGYGSREDNNTPYSRYDIIEENRAFADARQDPDQYLKRFHDDIGNRTGNPVSQVDSGSGDTALQGRSQRRAGYMNVKKDILPIFPKYLSLLLGMYSGMDHDITAEAQDLKSGVEREDNKWDTWFETKQRDFLDSYYASTEGQPQQTDSFIPDSIEELELFESMGGFKLKHEIAMESIIGHSFDISKWDDTIKRKMIEDMITNNVGATQDYLDIESNKVKTRYLDISNLIVPYNVENEYQNPEFHGYIRLYRAAELRLHGIPEGRIKTYAKNVAGFYGNGSWDSVSAYESNHSSYDVFAYDDFLVPVLECEWESVDSYFDQTRINREGKAIITEEYFDTGKSKYESGKYDTRPDRKIERINIKNRYQCSWILDSEDIISYGKIYDTPRPDNEVRSSVHVYRLNGRSILERCKENLDQIQIAWLKFQNAVALAAPPGIAVEYDALSNISTGDGLNMFHPLEILKIRSQTGNLIYKVAPMGFGGNTTRSNAGKPIEPLEGGMGSSLQEFNNLFQMQIGMIQQNTGISGPADASNPDPNQSVRGSELALSATSNTLKPLYDGYISIKAAVADNVSYKVQLLIQTDKKVYEAYYPVVGKAKLQTLEIAGKLSASSFGIDIEARPTNEIKADIKEQIKIGMQVGREGQSSLSSSQGLMLLNMIENGTSLKLVTTMLQYYEKKDQERLDEKATANIEQQGEQARLNQETASKLKDAELVQANNLEIQKNKAAEEETRITDNNKHTNRMEELRFVEKLRKNDNSSIGASV